MYNMEQFTIVTILVVGMYGTIYGSYHSRYVWYDTIYGTHRTPTPTYRHRRPTDTDGGHRRTPTDTDGHRRFNLSFLQIFLFCKANYVCVPLAWGQESN